MVGAHQGPWRAADGWHDRHGGRPMKTFSGRSLQHATRQALSAFLVLTGLVGPALLAPTEFHDDGNLGHEAIQSRLAPAPNIILITTDDQNRNELRWMPHT